MTTTGVDYSFWRPALTKLKGDGFTFVSRYLSWLPNGKVIDKTEYNALIAAGFTVFLNWEYAAKDALRGAAGGTKDATEAVRQAQALGYPKGATIYFSADFDETPAQAVTVLAYSIAAAQGGARRRLPVRHVRRLLHGQAAVRRARDRRRVADLRLVRWPVGLARSPAPGEERHRGRPGRQGRDLGHRLRRGQEAAGPRGEPKPPVYLKYPLPSSDWYGVDDGTRHSHSGKSAADRPNIKRIQKLVGVVPGRDLRHQHEGPRHAVAEGQAAVARRRVRPQELERRQVHALMCYWRNPYHKPNRAPRRDLMNIKSFAIYAGERALKTLGQTALALVIAAHGILDVSWVHVADVAGLAMVVSVLTSLASVTGGSLSEPEPKSVVSPDPETDLSVDTVSTDVNPANEVPAI